MMDRLLTDEKISESDWAVADRAGFGPPALPGVGSHDRLIMEARLAAQRDLTHRLLSEAVHKVLDEMKDEVDGITYGALA